MTAIDLASLADSAESAATFLKLTANASRLRILCHLQRNGETTVNALAEAVGLGQSALSQHLAQLREAEIVACRRQAQTIFYRVADRRALRLLRVLAEIFCPQP